MSRPASTPAARSWACQPSGAPSASWRDTWLPAVSMRGTRVAAPRPAAFMPPVTSWAPGAPSSRPRNASVLPCARSSSSRARYGWFAPPVAPWPTSTRARPGRAGCAFAIARATSCRSRAEDRSGSPTAMPPGKAPSQPEASARRASSVEPATMSAGCTQARTTSTSARAASASPSAPGADTPLRRSMRLTGALRYASQNGAPGTAAQSSRASGSMSRRRASCSVVP